MRNRRSGDGAGQGSARPLPLWRSGMGTHRIMKTGLVPAQYEPRAAKDVPFLQEAHAGAVTGRQVEIGHELIPKMVGAYLV